MRWFLGLAGALLGLALAIVVLWPAAPEGPQEIPYGRAMCATCRMHLSQRGFAGEALDPGGRVLWFDDVGCLMEALRQGRASREKAWVEDHLTARLVPLEAATLVRGDERTPMGHGLLALGERRAAEIYTQEHHGTIVALASLVAEGH